MSMKWFAMVLIAVLAAGCATTGSRQAGNARFGSEPVTSRDVVLTVHGLSCPLCSNNLDGQLRRIEGVERATIDLKTGAVSVHLADGHSVSETDLARAVEDAGFTLKKIETGGPNP